MRQIREVLRQKWALGLSHRAVARSLRVGLGTISSLVTRAEQAGLATWCRERATEIGPACVAFIAIPSSTRRWP
jgi:transposase